MKDKFFFLIQRVTYLNAIQVLKYISITSLSAKMKGILTYSSLTLMALVKELIGSGIVKTVMSLEFTKMKASVTLHSSFKQLTILMLRKEAYSKQLLVIRVDHCLTPNMQ